MITVDNKYSVKDVVYLKTDSEQLPRIVISICVNAYDILYEVITGTSVSKHYDFELSIDKNILITIE